MKGASMEMNFFFSLHWTITRRNQLWPWDSAVWQCGSSFFLKDSKVINEVGKEEEFPATSQQWRDGQSDLFVECSRFRLGNFDFSWTFPSSFCVSVCFCSIQSVWGHATPGCIQELRLSNGLVWRRTDRSCVEVSPNVRTQCSSLVGGGVFNAKTYGVAWQIWRRKAVVSINSIYQKLYHGKKWHLTCFWHVLTFLRHEDSAIWCAPVCLQHLATEEQVEQSSRLNWSARDTLITSLVRNTSMALSTQTSILVMRHSWIKPLMY